MLRTTTIRSVENLPLDMAEDTEVGSGTSSTTRSAKNLPSDMAEDDEIGGNSDRCDDETVKRLPLSKNSNRPMGYLTFLHFDADSAPFAKRWVSLDSFDYG